MKPPEKEPPPEAQETLGDTQSSGTLGATHTSKTVMDGAEIQEKSNHADIAGEGKGETIVQPVIEEDPTSLEIAGDWLTVTRKNKKKKQPIKTRGPHDGYNHGGDKGNDMKLVRGEFRATSKGFGAKDALVVNSSGPTAIKSLGGKKRRKGEDFTRPTRTHVAVGNVTAKKDQFMSSTMPLANGVFTAGTMQMNSTPELVLLKNDVGGSHLKKLGSNVEGPFEPSGQKLTAN